MNINLRNSEDHTNINARTSTYRSSFLPTVVRQWNQLPAEFRNQPSLLSFKQCLNMQNPAAPKFYYYGRREEQIIHARLRTKCSSLNEHLYSKNLLDSPLCRCGVPETTAHYLLTCPLYTNAREETIERILEIQNITVDILLYGCSTLPTQNNEAIFERVQKYITATKRF